jgi:serine/threonine-protein kinase
MIGSKLLDRYRIDSESGRGGMGVVYRAFDTLLEREVAIKVLSERGLSADGQLRLLEEARAAAGLSHPNIVTVYDIGEFDQGLFIQSVKWAQECLSLGKNMMIHIGLQSVMNSYPKT